MMKAFLGALALTALMAGPASALTIDFSSAVWAGANGEGDFAVGDVEIDALPDMLSVLTQGSDGVGVATLWNPGSQIGTFEVLAINFANPFLLSGFSLTNLGILENGYVRADGGNWIELDGAIGGNVSFAFSPIAVNTLEFGYNYFTLESFKVKTVTGDRTSTAVPEPATLALLGVSLLGLGSVVPRRRA